MNQSEKTSRAMNADLNQAMRLAGENLLNALNPERNHIPYWEMEIQADYHARLNEWWPQHNLGRWWDAMLRLEAAIGFQIPHKIEAAMMENLQAFLNNPDHLCLQPLNYNPKPFPMELHSLREGLLALLAIIKYRNNEWAREKGHLMLQTLNRIYMDNGCWDRSSLNYAQFVKDSFDRHFDAVGSSGRLLEALVLYYKETGEPLALDLADRIAAWHFIHATCADGTINPVSKPDHTHSYFGMLKGLLLYGLMTDNRDYIERVVLMYANTVGKIVKPSGFTAHDLGTNRMGETSSGGDAMQLALWLADAGYMTYVDDAERIIRARILPAQLTKPIDLIPLMADGCDCNRNLTRRSLGGFAMHRFPHGGKINTTDVTAHVLQSMIDAYQHIVRRNDQQITILLHFDYQDESLILRSERYEKETLYLTLLQDTAQIRIRVPQWVDDATAYCELNDQAYGPGIYDDFAVFTQMPAGTKIKMVFELPERITEEETDAIYLCITQHWP